VSASSVVAVSLVVLVALIVALAVEFAASSAAQLPVIIHTP
jgi:hypothetical protein